MLLNKDIYTVTVFSDMTHIRCVGFFYNLDEAISILSNNDCDIYEGDHDYAVIEKFSSGLYPQGNIISYYEYDEEKEGYVSCDTPKGFDLISNFALG